MSDKKPPSKVDKALAREMLWRRGVLKFLLDPNQVELYEMYYKNTLKTHTWLLARRCLAEDTLIKTPNGLVKIQDLKIGDQVFGYNADGTVSVTNVVNTFQNGVKEVWDLCNNGRVIETCTKDHVWLTVNEYDAKYVERQTKDIKPHNKIVREWVSHTELKGVHEPHAYAIAALLGDGCSRQGTKKIHISSENGDIPNKVAQILGAKYVYRQNEVNYTWVISNDAKKPQGSSAVGNTTVHCNYYDQWCRGKYAHEKTVDLDIIKSWNPESQLAFLAGIIDTDGSFYVTTDGCLAYNIEMQAYPVIEACQYIIHNLFQHKCTILINNREKFVNGPTYSIKIKNNMVAKRMLRALAKHQAVERKRWHPDYETFKSNNTNPAYMGVKIKNPRMMKTYDITVGNETNLYLTANGLVTHNSGKSFALCVLAIETCLRNPGVIVKFLAPTRVQVNLIIRPLMRKIMETCPSDIAPTFHKQDNIYRFYNGSEIQLSGSDGGAAERLRGTDAHLCIIDEAGSVNDLSYTVRDILLPATLVTKGKLILASTPPADPEHDFLRFIEEAEARNTLVVKSIDDNPRVAEEEKQLLIKELGGPNSDATQRELYCKVVKSKDRAVIPEFDDEKEKEIVKDWKRPPFYDAYVAMDVGYRDWTVVLFGYYDFLAGKIIIEDEIVTHGQDMFLPTLAKDILEKEKELYTNPLTHELVKPYKRVSDHNLIAINEIKKHSNYQIMFQNAQKDDKHAALNHLRVLIGGNNLIVSPKCKTLIRHLRNATWASNSTKDTFARCPQGSHYDAVDACIYLVRAIDMRKNPYPKGYGFELNPADSFTVPTRVDTTKNYYGKQLDNVNVYKSILNIRKR